MTHSFLSFSCCFIHSPLPFLVLKRDQHHHHHHHFDHRRHHHHHPFHHPSFRYHHSIHPIDTSPSILLLSSSKNPPHFSNKPPPLPSLPSPPQPQQELPSTTSPSPTPNPNQIPTMVSPSSSPTPKLPSTILRRILATTLAITIVTTSNNLCIPTNLNPFDWQKSTADNHRAEAAVVVPIPINPYAKRRKVQAYEKYLRGIEREIEEKVIGVNHLRKRTKRQFYKDHTQGTDANKKMIKTDMDNIIIDEDEIIETKTNMNFRIAAISAFIASGLSVLVVHPIDSAKIRIQGKKMGIISQVEGVKGNRNELINGGFNGLYVGVFGNLLKEAPNAAIYLGIYEYIKTFLFHTSLSSWPLFIYMISGAIGDAVGSIVRVPAELVSKRLQLGLSKHMMQAIKDCFFSPVSRQITLSSWFALLCRDVPYGGLQIGCYEMLRNYFIWNGYSGLPFDILCGAISGWFASLITTPADILVTRVSSQYPQCDIETKKIVGLRITLKRMVERENWTCFLDGMLQRSFYYAPLIGLFFALYEGTRFTIVHPDVITTAVIGFEQVPSFLYAYVHAGFVQVVHAWSNQDGMFHFLNTAALHMAKYFTVLNFKG